MPTIAVVTAGLALFVYCVLVECLRLKLYPWLKKDESFGVDLFDQKGKVLRCCRSDSSQEHHGLRYPLRRCPSHQVKHKLLRNR